ncbi:unnamed protein product [Thelazia callipaeda]|uniref:Uncharacterized protein n=1 Tax=Thelazia callipaeda TaxID=103827 RepID=A0A0N5CNG4_THECL|nr:unnamed protein product [Thelazia callipaeda]
MNDCGPSVPDRQAFQQALRDYNRLISETARKIDNIVGCSDNIGSLNLAKQSKEELRERREQLKFAADQMKIEINEIKKRLIEKDALLSNIENDLVYRDETRLMTRLRVLESAYSETKFTSGRAEKALITEIDKLKRNRSKIAKYNVVMGEKRTIQFQLHGINERRSNVLKSIREITNHLYYIDENIRQQRRNFSQLKMALRKLHNGKKELIDNYNKQKNEYINWSNNNRISSSRQLSLPYSTAHQQKLWINFIDEETLEPFYEQKMACKRLIEYLTALQSQLQIECTSSVSDVSCKSCKQQAIDLSDDSSEEYRTSFALLTVKSSLALHNTVEQEQGNLPLITNTISKKKICKKSSKKPYQKICHPVQMVCLFEEIDVPVPHNYGEIEHTLEEVRTLLKQYQEQTKQVYFRLTWLLMTEERLIAGLKITIFHSNVFSVIIWEECDYQKLPSLSESELTSDSTWNGSTDMSEHGSAFNAPHLSPLSDFVPPFHPTKICQQEECSHSISVPDEGFGSKNSTH